MPEYTFRVPLPLRGLGQNARGHWSAKSKVTAEYRREVVDWIMAQLPRPAYPLLFAEVRIEARVHRGRPKVRPVTGQDYLDLMAYRDRYRPTDADNLLAACKPLIDALQPPRHLSGSPGAGIIVNDDAEHLSLHPPTITTVRAFAEEGIIITVSEPRLATAP